MPANALGFIRKTNLKGGFVFIAEKVPCSYKIDVDKDSNFGVFVRLPPNCEEVPKDYIEVGQDIYLVHSLSLEKARKTLSKNLSEEEQERMVEGIVASNRDRARDYFCGQWKYQSVKISITHPILNNLFDGFIKPHTMTFGAIPSYKSKRTFNLYAMSMLNYLMNDYMGRSRLPPKRKGSNKSICLMNLEYAIRRLKEEKGDAQIIAELEKNAQDIRDWLASDQ